MTKEQTLNALKARADRLEQKGSHNAAIVAKLRRKIRNLETNE